MIYFKKQFPFFGFMKNEIHIHVHVEAESNCNDAKLEEIKKLIITNNQNQKNIMATLNDVVASVAAENTIIDSAITLLNELSTMIGSLQPNQAAIDQLAADIAAKKQALVDAITANTPAAPASAGTGDGSTEG